MSLTEITLILVVALILFGPEDLPVVARAVGKVVFQVRKFTNEIAREFQAAVDTPMKVINESLKDTPFETNAKAAAKDTDGSESGKDKEELLTYKDSQSEGEKSKDNAPSHNPLGDLPRDILSQEKINKQDQD